MSDYTEVLLEELEKALQKSFDDDRLIKEISQKVADKLATYKDANEYAYQIGNLTAGVFQTIKQADLPDGRISDEIADTVVKRLLEVDSKKVSTVAMSIQKTLNEKSGIGLNSIDPRTDSDRLDGIVQSIKSTKDFSTQMKTLNEPVKTFTQGIIDDCVRKNVEFQGKSGLRPTIERIPVGKCCKWCSSLAGKYSYPNVPRDVYRRHENCRCLVLYNPGDGSKQNVWTKKVNDTGDIEEFNKRKAIGIESPVTNDNGLAGIILTNPKMLSAYSPNELKTELEDAGYATKLLQHGNYKNVEYESGGGYKVTFDGDCIIMYHPDKRSHHFGEYFKIGNGKTGIKRYTRYGEILND